MSNTHSYAVERETKVTIRDFEPDGLKERDAFAWVLVGTLDTDVGSYAAMHEWFDAGDDREVGRYRLVEFTSYGGNFIEFEVKQKLILEEVRRLAEVA